jgi:hypothetical protein
MSISKLRNDAAKLREQLSAEGECPACRGGGLLLHVARRERWDGTIIEEFPSPPPCAVCGASRVFVEITEQLCNTPAEVAAGRARWEREHQEQETP